ncbi:hypothetical protein TPHA_0H01430 [Tetrapisispora phaffii CBS 4417]|uniref:Eukaryotic translation initiation factor 3 subunit J n=1 Tax=Tetrapisispora phaffii (strain ATCC 24235 / CBS 4417 / NBRC 1672 / NRRL Y-8282 / UCD 70-5) TaxID=1071381 RepID=G8BX45_TETPH|nr:hypothetical protein TPHA_0H01430 [Tetrapisispora phaffii CBS 4417]CCE64349.1 hypothetical protein TPHA_0H01430 [Tetrapisispora phaffii CBS 4417]
MSWDDDFVAGNDDDTVLMESWDAEETIEEKKQKEAELKRQEQLLKTQETANKKNKNKSSTDQVLMEIDTLDDATRKELIKKAELESDLNNAAELFGSLGVAEEHPRALAARKEKELEAMMKPASLTRDTPLESHPIFNAESKKEFQDLRKAISAAVTPLNEVSSLNYSSSLAIDLIRDVANPMSVESIRQTIATLNVLMKDKERQERQARLARVKGGTATGGAGKKKIKGKTNLGGAFKKDQDFSLETEDFGDFGDDDFM